MPDDSPALSGWDGSGRMRAGDRCLRAKTQVVHYLASDHIQREGFGRKDNDRYPENKANTKGSCQYGVGQSGEAE